MEESSVSRVEDLGAPPESWEVADLEASVKRLMLSSSKNDSNSAAAPPCPSSSNTHSQLSDAPSRGYRSSAADIASASVAAVSEELINSVDQFLQEAIQNPRERLSVLRIEQDVQKFVRDPTRQQMEFQQLPTSYLRLAAHRIAQHYSLQSMVLLDNNLSDGSGSKIIVHKTPETRFPLIRLSDIPINLPMEDTGVGKVAIKQRPQKGSESISNSGSPSLKGSTSKSVEERKEEYNRARARIFNSNISIGVSNRKTECEQRIQDSFKHSSLGLSKMGEKSSSGTGFSMSIGRGQVESSTSSDSSVRSKTEKEPDARAKSSHNKVAIFRDREVERKDPDYDRSYERYTQRFDPGFGFNGGPYSVQPMYAPALNYNTEFPQLGSPHGPSISTEHQTRPLSHHLPGTWVASSSPGIGYGPPETMIRPFSPSAIGARANPALYLHSAQYHCQQPGMPFIHPPDHMQQSFLQSHQQQPDSCFGLARPR